MSRVNFRATHQYALRATLILYCFVVPSNSWCQSIAPCGQQLSSSSIYKGVAALSNQECQTRECDCVGDKVVGPYGDQYQCVEYVRRLYALALGVDTTNWAHYNADQYYQA